MSRLIWRLAAHDETITRYCHGCGKTTEFRNSGKIRRNANGKCIFQFEIFKCSHDHTWNRSVAVTPMDAEPVSDLPASLEPGEDDEPLAVECWRDGIEIHLEYVSGKWRLDKVLASRLDNATRAMVASMIAGGKVLLNGLQTEGKKTLRTGDVITIVRCH